MRKTPGLDEMTEQEFKAAFPDNDACFAYLKARRWPKGVHCPRCGNEKVYELASRPWHWQCPDCAPHGYRFSVLVGTVFENTKVSLRAWFKVIHRILTSKKRVTAPEIRQILGFGSYKTALSLSHRIRDGLKDQEFRNILGLTGDRQAADANGNGNHRGRARWAGRAGRGWARSKAGSLRESELRYRRLFEAAEDGILILDAETSRILDLNPSMAELLGSPHDEQLSKFFWDIPLFEDASQGKAAFEELRAKGHLHFDDLPLRTRDGRELDVELVSNLYRENGKQAIQCNVRDVTERKTAEREAAAYLAVLAAQQEAAPDGVVAVDPAGEVISFNQRYFDLWGFSAEDVASKLHDNMLRPLLDKLVDSDAFLAQVNLLQEQQNETIRQELSLKDGRTLEYHSAPMTNAEGRHIGRAWFFRDITERKLHELETARHAGIDALTGLPSRSAFRDRLATVFSLVRRGGGGFAVIYLDVDRFRNINETLGDHMGDLLLREIAARLKVGLRETDFVARLGEDEFAILQTNVVDPADSGALAAKIRGSLAAPYSIEGNDIHATVSIGISLFSPDIARPDVMIGQAELALNRAKERGRDRYCFQPEELDLPVHDQVELADELRAAIPRNELELYYQPQVELASGRIAGMEALVRWNHPERGLLKPPVFIPIAEKTGGIRPLGHWVLREAFQQVGRWRRQGIAPPIIAVNLSAAQFKIEHEFEASVAEDLRISGIAPNAVELELTEAALMETTRAHKGSLDRLRALGLRVAVDDFGAGYSSLEDFRDKRVNRLKLAQKHVRGATSDPGSASLVQASIDLARELGIETIAPGVEAENQRDFLAAAGCRYLQGYYFSEPVQADRATQLLTRREISHPGRSDGD
jgi:diguanylate cyclase (GGDEF)-like protein/PAS domain S-box-containing protein